MTYVKKVWELGEDITPDELNNIEDGISSAHEKIDQKSDSIHNHDEVYAKKEDLNSKADKVHNHNQYSEKETTYTKVETDNKIKEVVDSIPDVDLSNYYNKQEVDQKIKDIVPPDVDISSKADKTYVDSELTKVNNKLNEKADKTTTYTKSEVDTKISEIVIPEGHTHNNKALLDTIQHKESTSLIGKNRVTIEGNNIPVFKNFYDLKAGDVLFAGEFVGLPNSSGYETFCYVNVDILLDEFTVGSENLNSFINTNYLYLTPLPFVRFDTNDSDGSYMVPDYGYTKKQLDEMFSGVNSKLPTSEQIAMIHTHSNDNVLRRVRNTSNQFDIGDLPLESRDFPFQEGEYLHAGDWILERDTETLNYFKVLITSDAFQWTNSMKGSAYSYGIMANMNQCAIISETDFTQGYTRPATEKDLELYAVKSQVDSELKKINDTLNGVSIAVDKLLEVAK